MPILKLIAVFLDMLLQTGFYIFPVLALCALAALRKRRRSSGAPPSPGEAGSSGAHAPEEDKSYPSHKSYPAAEPPPPPKPRPSPRQAALAFVLALGVVFAVRIYAFAGMGAYTRRYLILPVVLLLIPAALGAPYFVAGIHKLVTWIGKRFRRQER